MVEESGIQTMYATKRRRRSVKAVKPPMKDPPKSNPSKRHRLRLNGELDNLASLLPFEQSVISKLDKLSILRLAVSYLRTKSYFSTALHERYTLGHHLTPHNHHLYSEPSFTDTDSVLQALSGFLFVVNCDGEVFFASRTVEQYLGFHQSDIIHQSALELIHSEDREEFKNQLNWRSQLHQDQQDMTLQQMMMPENNHLLHRCFTVRFRCLLDNTSGFITLEISGRIKILSGQSLKGDLPEPPLALFALCCPFGPLPLLDVPPRDYTFKSKHKMDMAPISMDPRGKLLFGYSDQELLEKGGYDLIHPDDLTYYAAAHQELIKTGSSGLIAYRLLTKDFRWIWLQTSSKVVYKNSKPDFVICTHRHLTEDEGRDLVGKRGSEFKLPYPIIDTDPSGFGAALEEDDMSKIKSTKKKSKTQLRDYLQAGRKRKTPYREVYNGLNGYAPYTGLNGYPSGCQTGEMKPEFMYPYTANNFGLDPAATDLYRTGYSAFASSMYPSAESLRIEAEKHSYTNGYYLEPRQYQHTLQYHGNGYTDLVAQSSKYGYDVSKYGYEHMGAYSGLDLTKRHYGEHDISRYDADYRKYDYSSHDKLSATSRDAASYDPVRSGSLYGTATSIVGNNDSILSCNVQTNSPCYRPDLPSATSNNSYNSNMLSSSSKTDNCNKMVTDPVKENIAVGHQSVIRSTSPRTPKSEHSSTAPHIYSVSEGSAVHTASTAWSACSKTTGHCKTSPQGSVSPMIESSDSSSQILSPNHKDAPPVALNSGGISAPNNPSPASATTAKSVIMQSGRARSCDKVTPITGGIAVPVVKSPSWLHHPLPTPTYTEWHIPSSTDGYSTAAHQRTPYMDPSVVTHTRTIMDPPKYATMRDGDMNNPLPAFSDISHHMLQSAM